MKLPCFLILALLQPVLAFAQENRARILLQADHGELQSIKASDGAQILNLSDSIKDPEKAKRTVAMSAPVIGEKWTEISFTVKASETTNAKLRLSADFAKSGDTWIGIDDVRSDDVEISNANFEKHSNNLPTGWTLQKSDGKQGELVSSDGLAASGENYVKVSHAFPAIQTVSLPANKEVTITIAARMLSQP